MPITEPIQLPPTLDQHKNIQRHARQRDELQQKQRAAQSLRAELVAERDRLRSERHQTDVSRLLGDRVGTQDDPVARLEQLDGEIDATVADEATICDALELFEIIAKGVERQVQAEIEAQIVTAALAVVRAMEPMAAELAQLNQQLLTLEARSPGLVGPVAEVFEMWHRQLRAVLAAGDR